ncbi:hypothetical protein [Spirosoma areae]
MRYAFFFLLSVLATSLCFGQIDSTQNAQRSANPPVLTPGINSPVSAPGTMMQAPVQPNVNLTPKKDGKRKTTPPSDPRAFGVGIPLGKTKKDSLR